MRPPTSSVNPPPPAPSAGRVFSGLTIFVHPTLPDAAAMVLANGGNLAESPYDILANHLVIPLSSTFPKGVVIKASYDDWEPGHSRANQFLRSQVITLINQFGAVREGGATGTRLEKRGSRKAVLRPEWLRACMDSGRILGRGCSFGGWLIEISFDGTGVQPVLTWEEQQSARASIASFLSTELQPEYAKRHKHPRQRSTAPPPRLPAFSWMGTTLSPLFHPPAILPTSPSPSVHRRTRAKAPRLTLAHTYARPLLRHASPEVIASHKDTTTPARTGRTAVRWGAADDEMESRAKLRVSLDGEEEEEASIDTPGASASQSEFAGPWANENGLDRYGFLDWDPLIKNIMFSSRWLRWDKAETGEVFHWVLSQHHEQIRNNIPGLRFNPNHVVARWHYVAARNGSTESR
ncbi:hypothetical protein IAT38_006184 [Cryptococcus sp. DSM 104549]